MNSISLKEQRPPLVRYEDLTPLRGMFLSYVNVSCQLCQHGVTGVSGCLEVAAAVGVMGMRSNLIRKYPCQMSAVEPNCFVSVGSSRNSTGKSIAKFVVDVLGY